jgi:hypothetical protein
MDEKTNEPATEGGYAAPMSFRRHVSIRVAFTNDPEQTLLGEATWIRS